MKFAAFKVGVIVMLLNVLVDNGYRVVADFVRFRSTALKLRWRQPVVTGSKARTTSWRTGTSFSSRWTWLFEIRIKICLSVQCRRWSHGWEEGRRQKEVKEKLNAGVLAKAVTAVLYKSQSPSRQFHAFLCGYSWDEDELSKLIHTRCGKYFPPLSLRLPVECHVISGFILRGKNITEQSKVVILSSLPSPLPLLHSEIERRQDG